MKVYLNSTMDIQLKIILAMEMYDSWTPKHKRASSYYVDVEPVQCPEMLQSATKVFYKQHDLHMNTFLPTVEITMIQVGNTWNQYLISYIGSATTHQYSYV